MALPVDILSLIPQKHPFVMVDELLTCEESSTTSRFFVRGDNVLVADERLTEAGLMENMAQTAAASSGYKGKSLNEEVAVGYIGAVKNFEVFSLPMVNDTLITEVKIESEVFDMTIISASVMCGDKLIAKCGMNIFIRK